MKMMLFAGAACALAVALTGCQSVLKDLQACERHYDGTVAGGGLTPPVMAGKAKIDCCPTNTVANADHTNCVPIPVGVVVVAPVNNATAAPVG